MIFAACALHMTIFVFISTFILYGIKSTLYGEIPELVERGISELWESAFLAVTAFVNCGITITSDSMHSYQDKPGVYLFVCIIILAGQHFAPAMQCVLASVSSTCVKNVYEMPCTPNCMYINHMILLENTHTHTHLQASINL
jgi:Trk-type K+ transport system membrane component